jgi:hypothetical protein
MNSTANRILGARRLAAATATTWLLLASATLSAQAVQPLRAAGMEIFYGLIPAEIVLGHPGNHPERTMHGDVPAWGEQFHLIVTLFDQGSGKRIHDAEIKATVFDVRLPGKRLGGPRKPLEPMLFAGAASYGNYFNMPGPAPYRIELEIRRQGAPETVKLPIEYRHALVTTKPRP